MKKSYLNWMMYANLFFLIVKPFICIGQDPIPNWYYYTCGNSGQGAHTYGDAIAIDSDDNIIYGGHTSGVAYRVLNIV